MYRLTKNQRLLTFLLVCIPTRFILDQIIINKKMWHIAFAISIAFFISGIFRRTKEGYFGGKRNWSNWTVSLSYALIGYLVYNNNISNANTLSSVFTIYGILNRLEFFIFQ